jgi:hypothetical protein
MYGDLNTERKTFKYKILPVTYCAPGINLQNRRNIMISIDRGGQKGGRGTPGYAASCAMTSMGKVN